MRPTEFWRLTPAEWGLMLDGHAAALRARERTIAIWMAPLLSATSGQAITAEQLLGEEPSNASIDDRLREGERKLKAIQRRLKRQKDAP